MRNVLGGSDETQPPDRWWIVALCVAIAGVVLFALLWMFPTSIGVWILAGGILVFVVVCYFNPQYRFRRSAKWCFGTAGVLAFFPTVVARANLEGIGAFEIASDSSPLVVLGFLVAGLYLAWLDSRQDVSSFTTSGIALKNTNAHAANSPNAVTGLTAHGNIVVNQGISEATFIAALDAQGLQTAEPRDVDEELVWRLIEDIKDARRRFERGAVAKHLVNLQKSFERSGCHWPKVLRAEALLVMAEEERARISRLRLDGDQVALTRLQELLKELRNA